MAKFEDMAHDGVCEVCGKETKVVVCASRMGAMSCSYCKDCLSRGLEPYNNIVAYYGCSDDESIRWFADKNERVLKEFYGKTKDEFINECLICLHDMENEMRSYE